MRNTRIHSGRNKLMIEKADENISVPLAKTESISISRNVDRRNKKIGVVGSLLTSIIVGAVFTTIVYITSSILINADLVGIEKLDPITLLIIGSLYSITMSLFTSKDFFNKVADWTVSINTLNDSSHLFKYDGRCEAQEMKQNIVRTLGKNNL